MFLLFYDINFCLDEINNFIIYIIHYFDIFNKKYYLYVDEYRLNVANLHNPLIIFILTINNLFIILALYYIILICHCFKNKLIYKIIV